MNEFGNDQSASPEISPGVEGDIVGSNPAVPVEPVLRGRSHRFRWAIAGSVVLVVVLVTAAAAFVLSGGAGSKSLTASVAPADTAAFVELRTDLPGNQRQKLADFMSRFPGFADRAQFDSALDDIFNHITRAVSPDLAYTSAFKPWMEGEISIAVLPSSAASVRPSLPADLGDAALGSGAVPTGDAVVLVALKDRDAAQTWIEGELSSQQVATTSETYAGETLYTLSASTSASDPYAVTMPTGYALTSQDLILGTVSGVKAALDTKTNGSLADQASYQAAMKSVSGDAMARFYLDPRVLVQSELQQLSELSSLVGSTAASPSFDLAQVPSWIAGSVWAESDRIVVEEHSSTAGPGHGNHSSTLAGELPGSTVAVFEAHSVGAALEDGLAQASAASSANPSASPLPGLGQIDQIQQLLGLIGGVGWIEDSAIALTDSDGEMGGGVVIQTKDADTATSKLGTLTSLLALGGSAAGLTSTTETYEDHTITVVTVPEGDSEVRIGLTAKDNLIVAGYTDAFAKAVIDSTPSNALATQADYQSVMNAVGSSNQGSVYVDIPAIEDQIGKSAVNVADWNLNYKPYFDHLGGLGAASIDDSTSTMRIVLLSR